jgi:hypothetical protein
MQPQNDKSRKRPNAVTGDSNDKIPGLNKLGPKNSRIRPNTGGSGAAKKYVAPAQYKFKWPSVRSAYDARGSDTEIGGARSGGLNGMNYPDKQVKVSGRKGAKRIY